MTDFWSSNVVFWSVAGSFLAVIGCSVTAMMCCQRRTREIRRRLSEIEIEIEELPTTTTSVSSTTLSPPIATNNDPIVVQVSDDVRTRYIESLVDQYACQTGVTHNEIYQRFNNFQTRVDINNLRLAFESPTDQTCEF